MIRGTLRHARLPATALVRFRPIPSPCLRAAATTLPFQDARPALFTTSAQNAFQRGLEQGQKEQGEQEQGEQGEQVLGKQGQGEQDLKEQEQPGQQEPGQQGEQELGQQEQGQQGGEKEQVQQDPKPQEGEQDQVQEQGKQEGQQELGQQDLGQQDLGQNYLNQEYLGQESLAKGYQQKPGQQKPGQQKSVLRKIRVQDERLNHLDATTSEAHIVDISGKGITQRAARARCTIYFSSDKAPNLIRENGIKKGDVIGVARVAGIMAAKRVPDLIPLCHPLNLTYVSVNLIPVFEAESPHGVSPDKPEKFVHRIDIMARVCCDGKTGVEIEALTAASTAALTVYDMCKSIDKDMRIGGLRLITKVGGKSGPWWASSSKQEEEW